MHFLEALFFLIISSISSWRALCLVAVPLFFKITYKHGKHLKICFYQKGKNVLQPMFYNQMKSHKQIILKIHKVCADTEGMQNFRRRVTNDVENLLIIECHKRFTTIQL